jgi:hypothetical protein
MLWIGYVVVLENYNIDVMLEDEKKQYESLQYRFLLRVGRD